MKRPREDYISGRKINAASPNGHNFCDLFFRILSQGS